MRRMAIGQVIFMVIMMCVSFLCGGGGTLFFPSWLQSLNQLYKRWALENVNDLQNATINGEPVKFEAHNSLKQTPRNELTFQADRICDEVFGVCFRGALAAKVNWEVMQWEEECTDLEGDIQQCTPGFDCDPYNCSHNLQWTDTWIDSTLFKSTSQEYLNPVVFKPESTNSVIFARRIAMKLLEKTLATLDFFSSEPLRSIRWRHVKFRRGSLANNFDDDSLLTKFHVPIDTLQPAAPRICIDDYGKYVVIPMTSTKELVVPGERVFNVCNQQFASGTVRGSYYVQAPAYLLGEGIVRDTRSLFEWLFSPRIWAIEDVSELKETGSWSRLIETSTTLQCTQFIVLVVAITFFLMVVYQLLQKMPRSDGTKASTPAEKSNDEKEEVGATIHESENHQSASVRSASSFAVPSSQERVPLPPLASSSQQKRSQQQVQDSVVEEEKKDQTIQEGGIRQSASAIFASIAAGTIYFPFSSSSSGQTRKPKRQRGSGKSHKHGESKKHRRSSTRTPKEEGSDSSDGMGVIDMTT
mmetsp:Transcript_67838/g.116555  ORF Transcript_67838/g.116555 Transcript_67838/m.116555 type:complete len:527 (+) Transcript_67838:152-1732(+)